MKKIYLLAVSMIFAASTFGQHDIELTLTSPASGSTVAASATQALDFKIVNNGPDIIASGSTIWFTYLVVDPVAQTQNNYSLSDGTVNGLDGVTIPVDLGVGAEITSTQMAAAFGGPITINTSALADGNLVFISCLGVATQATIQDVATNGDPDDSDMMNNNDNFIIGTTSSLSINAKEVNVYPNPATNYVNFKIDGLENGTVTINSVTGQEVVNTSFASGTKQVDVNHLNNGVYIYAVRNSNGEVVKTNKLVIRK